MTTFCRESINTNTAYGLRNRKYQEHRESAQIRTRKGQIAASQKVHFA